MSEIPRIGRNPRQSFFQTRQLIFLKIFIAMLLSIKIPKSYLMQDKHEKNLLFSRKHKDFQLTLHFRILWSYLKVKWDSSRIILSGLDSAKRQTISVWWDCCKVILVSVLLLQLMLSSTHDKGNTKLEYSLLSAIFAFSE